MVYMSYMVDMEITTDNEDRVKNLILDDINDTIQKTFLIKQKIN